MAKREAYWTIGEAAKRLGVTRQTAGELARVLGLGRPHPHAGNGWALTAAEVETLRKALRRPGARAYT